MSAPYDPAKDFLSPPEVFVVEGRRAVCDGPGGVSAHPRVYLEMGDEDYVDCPYCDRRFARRGGSHDPDRTT